MANERPTRPFNLVRRAQKYVVSGFIVFTFVAYAWHERIVHSSAAPAALVSERTAVALVVLTPTQLVAVLAESSSSPTHARVPTTTQLIPSTALPSPSTAPFLTTLPAASSIAVTTAPPVAAAPSVPAPTRASLPPTPRPVPTAVPSATHASLPPTPRPVPTHAPLPTTTPPPTAAPQLARGQYKDGSYTGPVADAYYGNVQVKVVIQQGKIATVQFLAYPQDRRTSQRINAQAIPYLQEEAIQAQSATVDVVSGATLTSQAFVQSLGAALNGAKG